MITEDEIRAIVRREPFVPVRLHMADGRTFEIWQPWQPGSMLIKKDWLHYNMYRSATRRTFAESGYVYLPWVERVEEIAPESVAAVG